MTADLAAWLLADDGPIAEDEAWARSGGRAAGGEHWVWQCSECDTDITPDPSREEFLQCPRCESWRVAVRSRETYPTDSVGPLPTFVISYAEEQRSEAAGHVVRWDPARVLAECAAKRRIIEEHDNVNDGNCGTCVVGHWGYPTNGGASPARWPCPTLLALAQPYAGRPGWREEWKL